MNVTTELKNKAVVNVVVKSNKVIIMKGCFHLQSYLIVKKKDIEIQPGFEPGSSEF